MPHNEARRISNKGYSPYCLEKLSEKPHKRAKRLTIKQLIATR